MQLHLIKMNRVVKISLGLGLILGTTVYLSRSPAPEPLLVGESKVKIKKARNLAQSEGDFPQVDESGKKSSQQAPTSQSFLSASSGGGFSFGGSSDIYGVSGSSGFPGYFGSGGASGSGGGDSGSAEYKIHKLKTKEEPLPEEASKTSFTSNAAPNFGGLGGFGGSPLAGLQNAQAGTPSGNAGSSKGDSPDFLEMGKAPAKKETLIKEEQKAEAPKSDILIPPTIASAPVAAKESSSSKTDLGSLFGTPASEKSSTSSGGGPAQQQAQAPAPQDSGGDKGGGQQPQIPMMPPPSDKGGGGSPNRKSAAEQAANSLENGAQTNEELAKKLDEEAEKREAMGDFEAGGTLRYQAQQLRDNATGLRSARDAAIVAALETASNLGVSLP